VFLARAQRPSFLHDYHAFHHNFTTKTPHENTAFPKTPLKTAHKTIKTTLSPPEKKSREKQV
jgi:hypothetical protein